VSPLAPLPLEEFSKYSARTIPANSITEHHRSFQVVDQRLLKELTQGNQHLYLECSKFISGKVFIILCPVTAGEISADSIHVIHLQITFSFHSSDFIEMHCNSLCQDTCTRNSWIEIEGNQAREDGRLDSFNKRWQLLLRAGSSKEPSSLPHLVRHGHQQLQHLYQNLERTR
jgi:hypothetical protein